MLSRCLIFFFVIAAYIGSAFANVKPIDFVPYVSNYWAKDYQAGTQNWAIAQDSRGVLYFANQRGLLSYDGVKWRVAPLPSQTTIRSIFIDNDDTIYVGSFEEFGYFTRDSSNQIKYTSLKDKVTDFYFHNDEVWNIVKHDNLIIFQTFSSYFVYDGVNVSAYKSKTTIFNIFNLDSSIVIQYINGTFEMLYEGGNSLNLNELSSLGLIRKIEPLGNSLIIFTEIGGVYNYTDGRISPWEGEYNEELKRHRINKVVRVGNSHIIVGTISSGVYAFTTTGEFIWHLNNDLHLQNNTILAMMVDERGDVWVAMDNGIALLALTSRHYVYEPHDKNLGMIYSISMREDDVYIASNQGLYYSKNGELSMVGELNEQVWFVNEYQGEVIVGHNAGTDIVTKNHRQLSDMGSICAYEFVENRQPRLIVGGYTGLMLFSYDSTWNYDCKLDGFGEVVKSVYLDNNRNIWAQHLHKGFYKLTPDNSLTKIEKIETFDSLPGSTEANNRYLYKVNGRIIFSDGANFYLYDDIKDRIYLYEEMNRDLGNLHPIHTIRHKSENLYWFISNEVAYLTKCMSSSYSVESIVSFADSHYLPTEDWSNMMYDSKRRCSYFCLNNSIIRVKDSEIKYQSDQELSRLFVSEFIARSDDSSERHALQLGVESKIPHNMNNVEISLAYPNYMDSRLRVRYSLNNGADEVWHEIYMEDYSGSFENLDYGVYHFKAEVFDQKRVHSTTELRFKILRPWWWSTVAISIYIFLFVMIIVITFRVIIIHYVRKQEKILKKQQRALSFQIKEIEQQNVKLQNEHLELELKLKGKDMSNVIMTNITYQKVIDEIKNELIALKYNSSITRKSLEKPLELIKQHLVSEQDRWNVFEANFDMIHENFFRKLRKSYPQLTSADLRLCALLRLNLPTKDIAKMLYISIRGVDSARYRLRKKLELGSDEDLSLFMIEFK